jgi:phosphoglucosamine mutase
MTRKYFGTDGIRGTANTAPMTAEIALKLGMAAGCHFVRGDHRHRVIIGKDTRLSGYMIEPALTAGLIAMGMNVVLVGPLPTPAISMLTRSMRADLGIMISASHNPYEDNGIKLFNHEGFKLSDDVEREIERLMDSPISCTPAAPDKLGRASRLENARGRYIEFVKNTFPKNRDLEGLKIVLDCANGAAYYVAPIILRELGAEVITINNDPNGFNINAKCGSTYPEAMKAKVLETGAHLGIALDGDADRLLMCDEKGDCIDGDQLMAVIAMRMKDAGELNGNAVVSTVMSNLGLELYLKEKKIELHRTQVGDRYVSEYMRENAYNFGGEQSGHIILSDYASTGDGLIAALQVLAVLCETKKPVSKAARVFKQLPQVLKNYRYEEGKNPDEMIAKAQNTILDIEKKLAGNGRILIRKSGTEPLIRVMAEGTNQEEIEKLADLIIENLG